MKYLLHLEIKNHLDFLESTCMLEMQTRYRVVEYWALVNAVSNKPKLLPSHTPHQPLETEIMPFFKKIVHLNCPPPKKKSIHWKHVSCLLSSVFSQWFSVSCLLLAVFCQLSSVSCLLSAVFSEMSFVSCLMSVVIKLGTVRGISVLVGFYRPGGQWV